MAELVFLETHACPRWFPRRSVLNASPVCKSRPSHVQSPPSSGLQQETGVRTWMSVANRNLDQHLTTKPLLPLLSLSGKQWLDAMFPGKASRGVVFLRRKTNWKLNVVPRKRNCNSIEEGIGGETGHADYRQACCFLIWYTGNSTSCWTPSCHGKVKKLEASDNFRYTRLFRASLNFTQLTQNGKREGWRDFYICTFQPGTRNFRIETIENAGGKSYPFAIYWLLKLLLKVR